MGTIATSFLHDCLLSFDSDPPAVSRRVRELLRKSPRASLEEAAELLRDAKDTAATRFLLAALAADDSLGPIVLDDRFPRAQAIRLMRALAGTNPGAALNFVQAGGGLAHVLRSAPQRVLRILELIGATAEPAIGAGVLALFLNHENPQVRSKAALLLGRANRDLAWVRDKLGDPDPRIRANAVESIWGVTGPDASALFAQALADPDNRVAGNACLGLYLCGDPAGSDALSSMARHANPRFRATAAWVMGETGCEKFAPDLCGLRDDPDADVRHAALQAATRIRRARAS